MKTFIKTIGTILSVSSIMIGLTALFTIDNAQGLTGLITYAAIMIINTSGGIYLLISTYPELTDLSEFDDKSLNSLEEGQKELEELREHNLLLIDRYMIFKILIRSAKIINKNNKEKYPHLYSLLYNEDLVGERTKLQEPTLEQIERFKEDYN